MGDFLSIGFQKYIIQIHIHIQIKYDETLAFILFLEHLFGNMLNTHSFFDEKSYD
jgi:hypothetical protein